MMIKEKIEQLMTDIKINYSCTVYYQITKDREFNNPSIRRLWYGDLSPVGELCIANMDYKYHDCTDYNSFYNELENLKQKLQSEFNSLKSITGI